GTAELKVGRVKNNNICYSVWNSAKERTIHITGCGEGVEKIDDSHQSSTNECSSTRAIVIFTHTKVKNCCFCFPLSYEISEKRGFGKRQYQRNTTIPLNIMKLAANE
ncbi:hypothetical protein HHI36_023308, partial [Cryptolaemus montrouzieri]